MATSQDQPLPSPEIREDITKKLIELMASLEAHPCWTPPTPPGGIYYVWDFANRSKYIMTELDNIREGKSVKYPDQIPENKQARDNEHSARLSFADVCSRVATVDELIQRPEGLMKFGVSQVDFGEKIRSRSKAVKDVMDATTKA